MKKVNFSLLFFMVISAFCFEYDPRRESEYYVNYFKEKEVENHIKKSDVFQDCKDEAEKTMSADDYEARNGKILECVQSKMNDLDDDGVAALGKALDSANYKLLSNKDNKQIREYLEDRFATAVYGDAKFKNDRSKQKIIGQDMYFKWYHSQLSKNFLSDASAFCLENVRIKNGKVTPNLFYFIEEATSTPNGIAPDLPKYDDPNNLKIFSGDYEWYELTKTDRADENKKGTQKKINEHLTKTFQNNQVSKFLPNSFAICLQAINKLCEIIEEDFKDKTKIADINGDKTNLDLVDTANGPKVDAGEGKRSCIMRKRIRAYRKTLANYDGIYKEFEKVYKRDPEDPSFIAFEDRFYGWGNKTNEKGIDQLVNISSNEVKAALENKDAEQFEKLGCDKDITKEECKVFVHSDDKTEEFYNITAQIEAQALLKQRELEKLKKDPSEFEKYLKDNGFKQELEAYKKGPTPDKMKDILEILRQKHIAEKKSLLAELQEEFDAKSLKKKDISDPNIAQVKKDEVKGVIKEELESKQDKAKDMIRYANILSSFIGVEVQDPDAGKDSKDKGKNKSSKGQDLKATGTITERNLIGLKVEVENQGENEQDLFQYLGSPDGSSRANNSNSTLSSTEIDNILSSYFTRDAYKPTSPNPVNGSGSR